MSLSRLSVRKAAINAFTLTCAMLTPLAAAPALAQSQPHRPVMAQQDLTANVGVGVVYGFAGPFSDDSEKANIIPWADFNWRDRVYGNPLDGLGYNVVKQDRLRAGVQLRPRYGGTSTIEELDIPGFGADAAIYAFARVPGDIVLGGRVMQDVTGKTDGMAWFVSAARQSVTPVGLLNLTAYLRGADGKTNNAYYGVPAAAATPDMPEFAPGAGMQGLGAAALLMAPLGDKWGVAGFVNAERSLGDVADSPLIRARDNGRMAYRTGVFVVRRFGWDN